MNATRGIKRLFGNLFGPCTAIQHELKFCFCLLVLTEAPNYIIDLCSEQLKADGSFSETRDLGAVSVVHWKKNTGCAKRPLLSNHIICDIQLSRCSNPLRLPFLGVGALTDEDKADILKIVDGHLAERDPFEKRFERVLRPCELRSLKIREYPWVIAARARLLCASLACLGHCCQANVKASAARQIELANISDFEGNLIPQGEGNKH